MAKAIHSKREIRIHFARSFYKQILGQNIHYTDLEDVLSTDLYKNQVEWVLNNDPSMLYLTFSYEDDVFGEVKTTDLIPNGSNIEVTEENKQDYIQALCKFKLESNIKP